MKKYIILSLFFLVFSGVCIAEGRKEEGSSSRVIASVHKQYPHYELVHINFSKGKMDMVFVDMESNFDSEAMAAKRIISIPMNMAEGYVISSGESLLIDGLEDTRLSVFKEQYCPISNVFKLLNDDFLTNNLGEGWEISKIGYIDTGNKESPFTWGITFVKKTGCQWQKKSFILEKNTLKITVLPIKQFGFEGLLTD